MAGVAGNLWTLGMGKQTAKGTPQATLAYRVKATGGDIDAARETIQLAETDASIQAGSTVVVGGRVEGTPEHYLRPDDFGFVLNALLGADAITGAADPYTHTITPATATAYYSLVKNAGAGALVDRYEDCKCSAITISGGAGGVLTYAPTWFGLAATLGFTDPGTPAAVTQTPMSYPMVVVSIGGVTTAIVESFSLTMDRGGEAIMGDGAILPADYVTGTLNVTGSMTILFENDQIHRKFLSGTTGGTALTSTVGTDALSILATESANRSIEMVMAGVAWTAAAVGPDPGGSPYRYALDFASQRQPAIADYIKGIVRNAVSTAY